MAWGSNVQNAGYPHGALGLGDVVNRSSPVQVGTDTNWSKVTTSIGSTINSSSLAIKTTGTLWGWGANTSG